MDLPDAMLGVWKIAEAAQVSVDDAAHITGKALTEFGHVGHPRMSGVVWIVCQGEVDADGVLGVFGSLSEADAFIAEEQDSERYTVESYRIGWRYTDIP